MKERQCNDCKHTDCDLKDNKRAIIVNCGEYQKSEVEDWEKKHGDRHQDNQTDTKDIPERLPDIQVAQGEDGILDAAYEGKRETNLGC